MMMNNALLGGSKRLARKVVVVGGESVIWSSSQPRRCLSSTESSSASSNEDSPSTGPPATLVQGPSLLLTSSNNNNTNRPSPSLFYMPGLRSLPFWTMPSKQTKEQQQQQLLPNKDHAVRVAFRDPMVTSVIQHLEQNYEVIKKEYLSAVMGIRSSSSMTPPPPSTTLSSQGEKEKGGEGDRNNKNDWMYNNNKKPPLQPDYDVNARGGEHATDSLHTGTWDWHSYMLQGEFQEETFAKSCPQTARVVKEIEHLFTGTPFGFCFFSTLQSKSTIKRHSGPMNIRLRCHLPIIVPNNNTNNNDCAIRVGSQVQKWQEGKVMVLDDSYPHEVWNQSKDESRVIFLLDIWHPDVTKQERRDIQHMFQYAKGQGWIGKKEQK